MAKGKKKSKKKDAALLEQNALNLKRILKFYDQYSSEEASVPSTEITKTIRLLIEEGENLTKSFLRPIPPKLIKPLAEIDGVVSIPESVPILPTHVRPFVRALIAAQVNTLKAFSVWNLCMDLLDCVELGTYLKLPTTIVQALILNDCLLQPNSLDKLAVSFNACRTLRILNLNYNEFGDDGCLLLCANLADNRTIYQLSLTYCDIGPVCGNPLGRLLVQTAVAEIILDGNRLGCQGAFDLIKLLLLDCERFLIDKQDKIRTENELKAQEALLREKQGLLPEVSSEEKKSGKKKKKKKKKKAKRSLDELPPFGPFVTKIHLFDNEIDCLQPDGLAIVRQTIDAYARLIEISEELEELDLDENVIGHVCGSLILNALKTRKENKLKSIKMNVSEKIDQFVFADILKLSVKMKKKRKRMKKKKKK